MKLENLLLVFNSGIIKRWSSIPSRGGMFCHLRPVYKGRFCLCDALWYGPGAMDAGRELVGQIVECVGQWLGLKGGNVKV